MNGVLAIYNGKKAGKTILFSCELDALPIDEINTFEHRSVNQVSLTNVVTMATWLFYVV
jgi:metal-dependent amidase/aminoacylase/carboxypeptidase family protein